MKKIYKVLVSARPKGFNIDVIGFEIIKETPKQYQIKHTKHSVEHSFEHYILKEKINKSELNQITETFLKNSFNGVYYQSFCLQEDIDRIKGECISRTVDTVIKFYNQRKDFQQLINNLIEAVPSASNLFK